MEIVEDRHGRGSILITRQLTVATWHEGDAILARIIHNVCRLQLNGPSTSPVLPLTKSYAWPPAIFVDEFNAGSLESATKCEIVNCCHGGAMVG